MVLPSYQLVKYCLAFVTIFGSGIRVFIVFFEGLVHVKVCVQH